MKRLLLSVWIAAFAIGVTAAILEVPEAPAGMIIRGSGGGTPCSGNYGTETAHEEDSATPGTDVIEIYRIALDPECEGDNPTMYSYMADSQFGTRFICYADNGSGTDPADFLWQTEIVGGDPADWYSNTTSMSVSGSYIWCGTWAIHNGMDQGRSGSGGISRESTGHDYDTVDYPDPWPTGTDTADTNDLSIYLAF